MRFRRIITSSLIAGVLACFSSSRETTRAMFRTDRSSYRPEGAPGRWTFVIRASLRNGESYPLYVVDCNNSALVALEKRMGESWKTVYRPPCLQRGKQPIQIAPGQAYRDVARILISSGYPSFTGGEIPGVYRARYDVYRRFAQHPDSNRIVAEPAPEDATMTNEFTLLQP